MAASTFQTVLIGASTTVLLLLVRSILRKRRLAALGPLPPGPKGIPILGNALDLPKTQEWLTYEKWGKEHGPIVHVDAMGQPIVILNSQKAAVDLLDKRSATYSDRPYLAMGGDLVGWDHTLVLTPYGERFRNMRKLFHRLIGARNSDQFWGLEEKETRKFLLRMLEAPEKFRDHIRVTAGAIILLISHGYTVNPVVGQDPFVTLADTATEQFSYSTEPGKWFVDLIPALKYIPDWFPGASFKKTAVEWRANLTEMCELPHRFVKEGIKSGTAAPSFTQELLESKEASAFSKEEEETIKWTAASLYSGGADTTVSAISTFFLAMAMNPEVVKKAQEELDRVVGSERLPNFKDRPRMPYVEAICKEVLRWGPVVPTGVPHVSTKDDVYEGYRIPKGTLVFSNIWGITHDETVYPQPCEFKPERYLDAKEDSKTTSFGYGRRICPGMNLADLSLWISVAMTLHVFDIKPIASEPPQFKYTNGTISHPEPFKCTITPRTPRAEELIRQVSREEETTYMPSRKEMDKALAEKKANGNGNGVSY